MQVKNLIVEEILVNEAENVGVVKSTLYEFGEPRWISSHREREGQRLGPMTILDEPKEIDQLQNMSIRRFGERKLHSEETPRLAISYKDRWTIPPSTVYTLVLPKGFIASHIIVVSQEGDVRLQLAVSHEDHLFYHTAFDWTESGHIIDIEARIENNSKHHQELLKSTEVVRGTNNYDGLRKKIGQGLVSSDFWFKLLELGSKYIGMP